MCDNKCCDSDSIVSMSAKCSDLCSVTTPDGTTDHGYVPSDIGICDGWEDYVTFRYCAKCGKIQGKFPPKGLKKYVQ